MQDAQNLPYNFSEQLHKNIGLNVKKLRKERKISQLSLSLAMGYQSVTTVSCAEIYYKKIHFNIEHLAKIAYILDVDICDFFSHSTYNA